MSLKDMYQTQKEGLFNREVECEHRLEIKAKIKTNAGLLHKPMIIV